MRIIIKIATYNTKGSAGKTPISTSIALDYDFAMATNEVFNVTHMIFPQKKFLCMEHDQPFPKFSEDISMVFDLAGAISGSAKSIVSALKQVDVVIVPIYAEKQSRISGVETIREIAAYTKNIVVVATKLEKEDREVLPDKDDWRTSKQYKKIKKFVHEQVEDILGYKPEVYPLRFSKAYKNVTDKGLSIREMANASPLSKHTYKGVLKEYNDLCNAVMKYAK